MMDVAPGHVAALLASDRFLCLSSSSSSLDRKTDFFYPAIRDRSGKRLMLHTTQLLLLEIRTAILLTQEKGKSGIGVFEGLLTGFVSARLGLSVNLMNTNIN